MKETIDKLTTENFVDMIENVKADSRKRLKHLSESDLNDYSLFTVAFIFLTNNKYKRPRNIFIVRDYLKQNGYTLTEIETLVKPDFLKYAMLRMIEKDDKNRNQYEMLQRVNDSLNKYRIMIQGGKVSKEEAFQKSFIDVPDSIKNLFIEVEPDIILDDKMVKKILEEYLEEYYV